MMFDLFLGFLAFSSVASCAETKSYTHEAKKAVERAGVVMFTPEINGLEFDSVPIGSAWALEEHGTYKIVTAQHVPLSTMMVPGRLEVCSFSKHCIELERSLGVTQIRKDDLASDWIYWRTEELPAGMKSSRLAKKIEIGEPVCVAGSPLGRMGEYTCGQVTNMQGPIMYIDARVLPGNSGGPVFDSKGDVLGMVVAIDSPFSQGMSPVSNSGLCLMASAIWF
jgi:hypothetical protein